MPGSTVHASSSVTKPRNSLIQNVSKLIFHQQSPSERERNDESDEQDSRRTSRRTLERSLQRTIVEHRRNSGVDESELRQFSTMSANQSSTITSASVSDVLNHRKTGKRVSLTINPLDNSTVIHHDENFWLVLRPTSTKRVCWDLLMMTLLIYVALIAPYRIGFDVEAEGVWLVWENLLDLFFICDIVVNFRTGYYEDDEEVMDWKRISANYLQVSREKIT
jgi:hypothetical protein